MIIEDLWDPQIKDIARLINKLHDMHDGVGVEKNIRDLLEFFKKDIPKKEKERKKVYFLQWSAYEALLKIIELQSEYLTNFKCDLIRLSRNPDKNIYERARDLLEKSKIPIENKKCVYLQIEDFINVMGDNDKVKISEIAKSLELSFDETLDWIKQLVEEKTINGYITNDYINIIKK